MADMKDLAIDHLQLFARVAALGSLSAVARERDAPASQVSRALARATPGYLVSAGAPRHPDELLQLWLFTNSAATHLIHWPFIVDAKPLQISAQGFGASSPASTHSKLP